MIFKKRLEYPKSKTFEGEKVNVFAPFNKCPNPIRQRENSLSISGYFRFQISNNELIPTSFSQRILVPFPIGSVLSEVNRTYSNKTYYHYHYMINSYENVKDRVFLVLTRTIGYHIIYINGIKVYEGSSKILEEVEITDQFRKDESNILDITFKENKKEDFIGIAGQVYLDSTPTDRIDDVVIRPSLKGREVTVIIDSKRESSYELTISSPSAMKTKYEFEGNRYTFKIKDYVEWDSAFPFFYQAEIKNKSGDTIKTLFSMHKYSVGKEDGIYCFKLNNKPFPIKGVMDSYLYTDGLIVPASTEHARYRVDMIKKYGFNSVRISNRLELPLYYYEAETRGLLVAQDINYSSKADLYEAIKYLSRFDSIFLININLKIKGINIESLYNELKLIVPDKLITFTYKNNTTGDLYSFKKNKNNPSIILELKFKNKLEGLYDFMKNEYIPNSVNGMVGFFYSSYNSIDDGIMRPDERKYRISVDDFKEIIE